MPICDRKAIYQEREREIRPYRSPLHHRSQVTYMGAHMRKFDTTQMYKRLTSDQNLNRGFLCPMFEEGPPHIKYCRLASSCYPYLQPASSRRAHPPPSPSSLPLARTSTTFPAYLRPRAVPTGSATPSCFFPPPLQTDPLPGCTSVRQVTPLSAVPPSRPPCAASSPPLPRSART